MTKPVLQRTRSVDMMIGLFRNIVKKKSTKSTSLMGLILLNQQVKFTDLSA